MLRLLASLLIVMCACDRAAPHECWRFRSENHAPCLVRGDPNAYHAGGEKVCFASFEIAVATAKTYGMRICGLNQEN